MDIVFGIDALIIGFFVIMSIGLFIQSLMTGQTQSQGIGNISSADLWVEVAFGLVIFGLLPFLWILGTRVKPWIGTIRYFNLDRPGYGSATGLGFGLAIVVALMLLGWIAAELGLAPDNQALDDIGKALDWPLVLAVSISAGVGEEIFFRGVLQKKFGMWGQAVVFGLLHISQGVFGVVVTGGLGLLFGYLVKRGFPLWTVIVAHVVYDAIILTAVLVAG